MAENRFTLGHNVYQTASKRRRYDANTTVKREKASSPTKLLSPSSDRGRNPSQSMPLGGLHGNLTSLASLERRAGLRGIRNPSDRRRSDAITTAEREKGVCLAENFAYCPISGSFWKAPLLTLKTVLDLSRSPHGRVGPNEHRSTRQTGTSPLLDSTHLVFGPQRNLHL